MVRGVAPGCITGKTYDQLEKGTQGIMHHIMEICTPVDEDMDGLHVTYFRAEDPSHIVPKNYVLLWLRVK